MERLFWATLDHLRALEPGFGPSGRYRRLPRRFAKAIHAIDSSTIALVANCMDWAKHRRRKAAAKLHMRLDLQHFLPAFAIVEEASRHDNSRARELCATLEDGEIALFDKAYIDFEHLFDLADRGVSWVTRAKENFSFKVHRELAAGKPKGIVRDQIIELKGLKAKEAYPI